METIILFEVSCLDFSRGLWLMFFGKSGDDNRIIFIKIPISRWRLILNNRLWSDIYNGDINKFMQSFKEKKIEDLFNAVKDKIELFGEDIKKVIFKKSLLFKPSIKLNMNGKNKSFYFSNEYSMNKELVEAFANFITNSSV